MNYTIPKLKEEILKNVLEVYEVFKNHFGEQYVDLQDLPDDETIESEAYTFGTICEDGSYDIHPSKLLNIQNACDIECSILVWWPRVTVTNEHGKSIEVRDLYAKVPIDGEGRIPYEQYGFTLNRTTYPVLQFNSNYMHSHVHCIPKSDFSEFQSPCLGSGPIKNTIVTLKSSSDTAMWMLFCEELSRYVTVESLTGIPYHRLENIGAQTRNSNYQGFSPYTNFLYSLASSYTMIRCNSHSERYRILKQKTRDFMAYYLQHGHLKFSFRQGKFVCGLSYYDYIIDVSNCFIDYYNKSWATDEYKRKQLFCYRILNEVQTADGAFYMIDNDPPNTNFRHYRGRYVLTFKGQQQTVRIIESRTSSQLHRTTLINHSLAMQILEGILKIINYRFQNEHTRNTSTQSAENRKTVCYL